jgi:GNAT superfamily N-acetyltransferase
MCDGECYSIEELTKDSMTVSVRRAGAPDARAIARVHVDSWHAAYPGLIPDEFLGRLSIEDRERQWTETLSEAGDGPLVLVAEARGATVGFSTVVIPARDAGEPEDVAEIAAIYVDPEAWGGGAGSALIHASVEEMRAAGCREAILWALAGNARAAGFYAKHGWRDDGGRRPSQYFPDAREVVEVRFRRALAR